MSDTDHTLPAAHSNASPCSHECAGRREFLRDAWSVATALAGLSVVAPLTTLTALGVTGNGIVRYPIPSTDSVSIDSKHEVILCRSKGEVYAFALSCPHQNTALRAMPGNRGFQCPRHKSKYQPDGTFIDGKATRNMDRLAITREGGEVLVETSFTIESDRDPAKWGAAVVKVG